MRNRNYQGVLKAGLEDSAVECISGVTCRQDLGSAGQVASSKIGTVVQFSRSVVSSSF